MKRFIKLLFIILLLIPIKTYALDTSSLTSNYYDYVIDSYDVNIVVNKNNTFDITETITTYFYVPKHGIYRTIPLKNKIVRLDGSSSTNHAKVTNVSVNNEFTTSALWDSYKIKIGSSNRTFTGRETYVIKYTYNIGKDSSKDYDELYYNIIGSEWDTIIGNVTFTITMPEEFDSSKLGFSSGNIGSVNSSNVRYNVNDKVITGSYEGILNIGEALTVRCELPEGYFTGASSNIGIMYYTMVIIPLLFLIMSILLWFKYGRSEVIETVEFYPPEGLNSLEVGYLYNGKASIEGVTSLLIYLANKGYLEISNKEENNDKLLSNTSKYEKVIELQTKIDNEKRINPNSEKIKYYENMLEVYKDIDKPIDYKEYGVSYNRIKNKVKFVINKLKDYDGTDTNEKLFMEGLFKYDRTLVTDKMLDGSFYKTNDRIISNVNKDKFKIFDEKTRKKSYLVLTFIILTIISLIFIPLYDYYGFIGALWSLIPAIALAPFVIPLVLITSLFKEKEISLKFMGALSSGMILSIMSIIFLNLPIGKVIKGDHYYFIGFILGVVCTVVMSLLYRKIYNKRNKYGNDMLGKIKGFKYFLEVAVKEELEARVLDNPNYFYDILPYTYVLGVSDKWINKFESISLQRPTWYDSSSGFDSNDFSSFVNSTMSVAQRAMSSRPYDSSGGGGSSSSGGSGRSGGGSGGGGGGSW